MFGLSSVNVGLRFSSGSSLMEMERCFHGGHCSLFTICGVACPFHASVLRPASQAGPMHEAAGMGEVS